MPTRTPRRGPLWQQVEDTIRQAINDGSWPAGSRIRGEEELTELHGVSRITVRHALANLAREGLVVRQRGRGTFVRDTRLVAGTRALTSFSDEMAALGVVADARLIDGGEIPALEAVAAALDIPEGAPVMRIARLRTGDGGPIGIQTTHLRPDRVPGFDPQLTDGASLYELLQRRYQLVPREAEEVFRVGAASTAEATRLAVRRGAPVFVVERLSRDGQGPFEFTQSTMRGDRYEVRSALRRH